MAMNGKVATLLIVTVAVMAGINSAALSEAAGNSVAKLMEVADLQGPPAYIAYVPEQDPVINTDIRPTSPEGNRTNLERGIKAVSSLFDTNSYFVTGNDAYCTDVLGAAKISYGLALGGVSENPEGRTEIILTRKERDQGNLIIVGGPDINPTAIEFGGYCGITYEYKPRVSFTISCERRSIYLDLSKYPHEDICIIYLDQFETRNVMLVWGYGWQGTYAGSTFMGNPENWEEYSGAHLLLLRWKDYNRDGLVQMEEIMVETYG